MEASFSAMDTVLAALGQANAVPAAMNRIVDHLQVGLISLVNTLSPDRVEGRCPR